jgi:hypothetical protein
MKRNLMLLVFLSFLPLYAFGDYVPGRTRASAAAEMSVLKKEGRFGGIQTAKLIQLATDGLGITGFTLQLNGKEPVKFTLNEKKKGRCGHFFLATYLENGRRSDLRVEELNPIACRRQGSTTWRAQLTKEEGPKPVSRLLLQGEPEFFLVSQ